MTPSQRVSAAMLRWQLERVVEAAAYADHQNLSLFEQRRGLHVALVESLTERASWRRPSDVTLYLARLDRFAPRLGEGLELARGSARRGFVPPRFILERVQTQLRMFLDHAPAANPLVATLGERMKGIEGLTAAAQAEALAKARTLVTDEIRPAYQRVLVWVEEVLPGAAQEAGWSRLPKGAEAYAAALRGFTTTNLGAAEIHAIGRREVARLEAEAEVILRQLGHTEGTFNERMAKATQGPLVEATDPRAALIARYTEYIRDAERRSEALFNRRPRAPVEVRRVPPLTERVSSAYYTAGQCVLLRGADAEPRLPRGRARPPLPARHPAGAAGLAPLPRAPHLRGDQRAQRGLGPLRGTARRRTGLVRGRSRGQTRCYRLGALPGATPRGGHGPPHPRLDARTGDRLRH
jgi:uncharacterized protein (DUF885 family)